jgi:hypothetical protein
MKWLSGAVDDAESLIVKTLDEKLAHFEATFSYVRALVPKGPVEFQEYPMWLEHPQSAVERAGGFYTAEICKLPPVLVNTLEQEEEYRAKGYERPGSSSSGDFMLAKASESLQKEIASWNHKYTLAMRKMESVERRVREVRARVDALENPEFED